MRPLHAGGSRLWRTVYGLGNWPLILAVLTALLVGSILARSTMVGAQGLGQSQGVGQGQGLGQDPSFFPATGYRISSPAVLAYFQRYGGVRSLGFPVSNDFPLLGHRVQIFQRQVLEVREDGSVGPVNILAPDTLPIVRMDGLSLPTVDPDMLTMAPDAASPDYLNQALSYVTAYVPDEWNGLPVNFQTTFLETVRCADAFGDEPCDPSQVAAMALDLWGLPTSQPSLDPVNSDFVYQRFERGIMHFSRATGLTQGLLVGDWFKRIMVGMNLAPDLGPEVLGSRFYAQFQPTRPLGLARANELPDTSLAQAFRADTLAAAGQTNPNPTLPPSVAETATAVASTATAITATQVSLQGTGVALTTTAIAATSTIQAGVPSPLPMQTAAPVSDIPVTNEGCLGDEQMWFIPRKPNVGTHVEIAVTSRRHHDVRYLRLVGPIDAGVPTERLGPLGFVWTWTVVPAVEAFHQWTFYADGLRPCITSGFNAFAPLGATATPTETPVPTNTPGTATATPTNTRVPAPTITSPTSAAGSCNSRISLSGRNFGSPPSDLATNAQLIGGPPGAPTPLQLNLIGGSDTFITVQIPQSNALPSKLSVGSSYGLVVVNSGGVSNEIPFTVTTDCGPGTIP
jgi:hypothetical protein